LLHSSLGFSGVAKFTFKWSLYRMSSFLSTFGVRMNSNSSPGLYVPYKKGIYPNFSATSDVQRETI